VRSIAQEYGVGFADITYLDSIVDYAVDCFDADPHLNVSGSLKMTDYIGSYLRDHYGLADRRSDPRYVHWNRHLETYKDEKICVLRGEENLNNVLMLLHDPDVDVRMAVAPDADLEASGAPGFVYV
jgi:hypothetical protein